LACVLTTMLILWVVFWTLDQVSINLKTFF
jgi:hypothetical protein